MNLHGLLLPWLAPAHAGDTSGAGPGDASLHSQERVHVSELGESVVMSAQWTDCAVQGSPARAGQVHAHRFT